MEWHMWYQTTFLVKIYLPIPCLPSHNVWFARFRRIIARRLEPTTTAHTFLFSARYSSRFLWHAVPIDRSRLLKDETPSGRLDWAPSECRPKMRYFLSLLFVLYLLATRFRCLCPRLSDLSHLQRHRLALSEIIVFVPRWICCDDDLKSEATIAAQLDHSDLGKYCEMEAERSLHCVRRKMTDYEISWQNYGEWKLRQND